MSNRFDPISCSKVSGKSTVAARQIGPGQKSYQRIVIEDVTSEVVAMAIAASFNVNQVCSFCDGGAVVGYRQLFQFDIIPPGSRWSTRYDA
jgi:hypothetical protein